MRFALSLLVLTGVVFAGGADQAAALLKKGQAQKAAAAARKLTEKDPTNIDAWLVFADAQIALLDPAEAWTAIEGAMEKNPTAAALSLKLGDIFIKMAEKERRTTNDGTTITNYYLDAERMYEETLKKDAGSADAVYGMAYVNFFLSKRDKAKKYIAQCLGLKKDHAKCLHLQAFMFYGDKKYPEAERIYEVALKLDDSDPVNMVRYGHSFYAQGKRDQAKAAYINALKRHPDNETAIVSGLYYLAGKKYGTMIPMLKEAGQIAPKSRHVWFHLGYGEFFANNFDAAESAFRRAAALKKNDARAVYWLGYSLEKKGNANGALKQYRAALKLSPDYTAPAGRFEGILRSKRNDIDAAEKLYEELVKLAPTYGWGMNNYALLLRDWAEARGAARQANPAREVQKRIKRSGEVYEMAAAVLTKEAQVQSDCGLLFEFYPCNRDDKKAERYFSEALVISEWTYRDAWSGIWRLCKRTKNWEVLKDHAEGVVGALEGRGLHAVAPVGGSAPREVKNQTPGMIAQAKAAIREADKHLAGKK